MDKRAVAIAILAAILLGGGALRAFHLGTMFLNGDEPLHEVRIAYQPLGFVLTYNSGPLFALLTHFLLPLGKLEIMARLVSFVSGLLIILLAFLVGEALFSPAVGLMAALFTAGSHLLVFFAQNSRTYALLTFLLLLTLYLLIRAVRSGRARFWAAYGLSLALFLFCHTVALFMLPLFVLFVGAEWLGARRRRPAKGRGETSPRPAHPLGRFAIATAAGAGLAVLGYLPCAWMRDMFLGSLRRGVSHPADALPLTAKAVLGILRVQISPISPAVLALVFGLVLLGLTARPKSGGRHAAVLAAGVVFPWLVFVLGKPRANDVDSLYRYFQYHLPLLFLLAGRGIESASSAARSFAARLKARRPAFIGGVAASALSVIVAAGLFANLRDYQYSDFWRQGSYPIDADVTAYLDEHADRDALLLIDVYPGESLTLIISPLTKDFPSTEIETAVRESYVRPAGGPRRTMIYVLEWPFFLDGAASRSIELWALVPKRPPDDAALRAAAANLPGVEVVDVSRTVLLRFKADGRPAAEKAASLGDILVSLPGDPILRRQRLLLAAKAYFMTRGVSEAIAALRAFDGIAVDARTEADNGGSGPERLLGLLLGVRPAAARSVFERRALGEIQMLLFRRGNASAGAGHLADAAAAYGEVLRIGPDFDSRVLDPLLALGDRFERAGDAAGALKAWEAAARLAPQRAEIRDRIAKIRAK